MEVIVKNSEKRENVAVAYFIHWEEENIEKQKTRN